MKKIITLGLTAGGLLWALGQRRRSAPVNTWAAGTDPV